MLEACGRWMKVMPPIEYSIIFTRPQQPRAQNKKLCVTKVYTLHNPEIKMLRKLWILIVAKSDGEQQTYSS